MGTQSRAPFETAVARLKLQDCSRQTIAGGAAVRRAVRGSHGRVRRVKRAGVVRQDRFERSDVPSNRRLLQAAVVLRNDGLVVGRVDFRGIRSGGYVRAGLRRLGLRAVSDKRGRAGLSVSSLVAAICCFHLAHRQQRRKGRFTMKETHLRPRQIRRSPAEQPYGCPVSLEQRLGLCKLQRRLPIAVQRGRGRPPLKEDLERLGPAIVRRPVHRRPLFLRAPGTAVRGESPGLKFLRHHGWRRASHGSSLLMARPTNAHCLSFPSRLQNPAAE